MNRVRWARAATTDLSDIRTYLIEAYSEQMAQNVISQLVLATRWLVEHPRAGARLEHPPWRKWKPRGTRYILIYEATSFGINVLRVRHERNDWRPVPK